MLNRISAAGKINSLVWPPENEPIAVTYLLIWPGITGHVTGNTRIIHDDTTVKIPVNTLVERCQTHCMLVHAL